MFRHKKTNFIGVSPAWALQKVCYFSHKHCLFSFISWCYLKFHAVTALSLNSCLLQNHHNQLWPHQTFVLLPNGKGTARLPLRKKAVWNLTAKRTDQLDTTNSVSQNQRPPERRFTTKHLSDGLSLFLTAFVSRQSAIVADYILNGFDIGIVHSHECNLHFGNTLATGRTWIHLAQLACETRTLQTV